MDLSVYCLAAQHTVWRRDKEHYPHCKQQFTVCGQDLLVVRITLIILVCENKYILKTHLITHASIDNDPHIATKDRNVKESLLSANVNSTKGLIFEVLYYTIRCLFLLETGF